MEFYNNLTGSGIFFFWLAIFLACFLVTLSVFLLLKNKKLSTLLKREEKKQIAIPIVQTEEKPAEEKTEVKEENIQDVKKQAPEEPSNEDKTTEEEKEETKEEIELLDIKDNKEEVSEEIPEQKEEKQEVEETPSVEEKNIPEEKKEESTPRLYQKNVLKKMPTSPVYLDKEEEKENISHLDDKFDASLIDEAQDKTENNNDENIESSTATEPLPMEEEKAEIIETKEEVQIPDTEPKEEPIEHKVDDKIYNISDEEEDDEFIEELKNLRSDLE